jgi:hypothetical protein
MTGSRSHNILGCVRVARLPWALTPMGAPTLTITPTSRTTNMDSNTQAPAHNILPFRSEDRRKLSGGCSDVIAESCDQGPSPEESLRIMRAFVGIKNRKLRANLIDMLEGASRDPATGLARE